MIANETNQTDVKQDNTASSGGDNTQQTSAQTQTGQESKQDSKEPTILEMAQKVHADYAKKEATPKEVKNADSDKSQSDESKIQELNPTDKKAENESEGDKADNGEESKTGDVDESELEKLAESKGPIPYERFKQVYTKSKELEQSVEQVKPLVEGQKQIIEYCTKNQITQEQFSQGLELLALMNSNPQEAVKRMANMVGELQDKTGDRLPDDLAAEVANGDLTENRAKEIAKLRAQTRQGEQSIKQGQQQRQQEQEQNLLREVTTSSNQWVNSKQSIDPDFRPKTSPNAVDGKYEWVREKYLAMTQQTNEKGQYVYPVRTGQDVAKYLELAYSAVEKSLASMRPKSTKSTKNLSANESNGGEQKAPTTIHELAKQVGAKHGITI